MYTVSGPAWSHWSAVHPHGQQYTPCGQPYTRMVSNTPRVVSRTPAWSAIHPAWSAIHPAWSAVHTPGQQYTPHGQPYTHVVSRTPAWSAMHTRLVSSAQATLIQWSATCFTQLNCTVRWSAVPAKLPGHSHGGPPSPPLSSLSLLGPSCPNTP